MQNTFFVSDTHFQHKNIVKFKQRDANHKTLETDLRPWDDVDAHDEALIENWNKVVKPGDKVYHLGDMVIPNRGLAQFLRLNGSITVIMGNHEEAPARKLLEYVPNLRGSKEFYNRGWICTHIPIHDSQVDERWKLNIHGHLHDAVVNDPRYLCVSMEHIAFTPLHIDDIEVRVKLNQERFEATGSVINFAHEYTH